MLTKYRTSQQNCQWQISQPLPGEVFPPRLSIPCPSSKSHGPHRRSKWRLSVLLQRRKEWEDTFMKKFAVRVDSEVGLPEMIGAFCVMAPPPNSTPELQELKKLVEDQRMAMEGLRKELAEVSAKSKAAAKRRMVGVPSLCKSELLQMRDMDAKPQWVYANLVALSTLLWRRRSRPTNTYRGFGIRRNSRMSRWTSWRLSATRMQRTTRSGAWSR